MHQLKGIYGIAYSCSTSKDTYCKDWYTSEFNQIFNPNEQSKRSLSNVKKLGFNNIRTYYLDPNCDHTEFLNVCDNLNLSIEIGISNNLLDNHDVESIKKIINNVKNHKCVKIYTIGNEYFNSIDNIIFVLEYIYNMDPNKYYMHSSIFDYNFMTAKKIYQRIPNYIKNKYIVGLNIYLYNNSANTHGDVIQNVLKEYYSDNILKDSYLIISEFGNNINSEQFSSLWNFSFGNLECLKKYPNYLGFELFSLTNESWKGKQNSESNYGILIEEGEPKPSYYAILDFSICSEFKQYIRST